MENINLRDFFLYHFKLPFLLARQDIVSRFRRSKLGPLWVSLGTFIHMAVLGLVFSYLLQNKFEHYFPSLSIGLIIWIYIESTLKDFSESLPRSSQLILNSNISFKTLMLRVIFKNFYLSLFNLIFIPFLIFFYDINLNFYSIILFLISFLFLTVYLYFLGSIIAIICCRYRDFVSILENILKVLFFLTPIIWLEEQVSNTSYIYFLKLNPFFGFIEFIRAPILEKDYFILIPVIYLFVAMIFYSFFLKKYSKKINFWL